MYKNRDRLKIQNVWRYMLFLFAFICCGFVFNTIKVSASPNIFFPNENGEDITRNTTGEIKSITFYVGFGDYSLDELSYTFSQNSTNVSKSISSPTSSSSYYKSYTGDAAKTLCNQKSFITKCRANYTSYKINITSKADVAVSGTTSSFTMSVYASTSKVFGLFGGDLTKNTTLYYDNKGPSITEVSLTRSGSASSNSVVKIGEKISFQVKLNENIKSVPADVGVEFKIGGVTKKVTGCSGTASSSVFSCVYTVKSGDSGNITDVKIIKPNYVKDVYGNAMSSTVAVPSLVNASNLTVDGVKPSVVGVTAMAGVYNIYSASSIKVEVIFSEELSVKTGFVAPTMKYRIGDGSQKTCSFSEVKKTDKKIVYNCSFVREDQGNLVFVSLEGGSGITDVIGNALNLPYSTQKTFSNVVVENGVPALSSEENNILVDTSKCTSTGSGAYCKTGDEIVITFKFNMRLSSVGKNLKIKFDGVVGKGNISYIEDLKTAKTLKAYYTVSNQDNGEMTFDYELNLRGENLVDSTISNNKTALNIFADNRSPEIGNVIVLNGEEEVEGNVIYGPATSMRVQFAIEIKEASAISVDGGKLYAVDSNGSKISIVNEGLSGIYRVNSYLVGKILNVYVYVSGECQITFKIKLEKTSIRDAFGNYIDSDFYSDSYTIDSRAPSFTAEVVYPENKGYNNYLISGNEIGFKINSSDSDLAGYCVVEDVSDGCEKYEEIVSGNTYNYEFDKKGNKKYSYYVVVKDSSGNETREKFDFEFKEMFTYSNGEGSIAKNHTIDVDVSVFDVNTILKYGWFKKGKTVSFTNANSINREASIITIEGDSSFSGEYKVCLQNVSANDVLCSAYVNFDTTIDLFDVDISSNWSNGKLPVTISFNDSSLIKCIVIGKNVSNINCNSSNSSDITIYRTSQAVNPLTKYVINENGIYYFYIEDAVGNNKTITKTIVSIDKDPINIEVFNGATGEYNTNLELDTYKKQHSFLVTFDRGVIDGVSDHALYQYFFTPNNYSNVNTKDIFDAYYLDARYKNKIGNGNGAMTITSPGADGIYNLYIMALDEAGNVSFKEVRNIMVDASGPVIKMYDINNNEVSGGSTNYIAVFEYNIVIEDKDSKLNLNSIAYKWVDGANVAVLEKSYNSCGYDYNRCSILGSEISFESGVFKPTEKYRFAITAYDNAGNSTTFISSEFMIDTTPPKVVIDIDEDVWYESGNVSFEVSKDNNGTLNSIAYCLNNCLKGEDYDLSKFSFLSVNSNTLVNKTLNLSLQNGVNTLYVYANDVFGNYVYEKVNIKYDADNVEIVVNNLNGDGALDLSDSNDLVLDFIIRDQASGIEQYCVYFNNDISNKVCYQGNQENEIANKFEVSRNGVYSIEAIDGVGKVTIYNVSVVGVDTEPIEFDLISNVKEGQFTNGNVTISVVNMRKFMVDNVEDKVSTIDYVKLPYNTVVNDNESALFSGAVVNSVYNKGTSSSLVTSFMVGENALYLVRLVDTADNISYDYIKVHNIDIDAPFINTNKYPDNSDRIYVNTSSGKNIRVFIDGENKVYKYSNEIIKVFFGVDSLKDLSTGYNSYLGLKICFETDSCVYNTYNVSNSVVDNYLTNNAVQISAPYNFSGTIRYYLVDGAGNSSSAYSFVVEYQSEVSEVNVSLKDVNENDIDESNKYSNVVVYLSGEEVNEIIGQIGLLKYALVRSNVNLHNQLANMNVNSFLSTYGFVNVTYNEFGVTKSLVDDSYYLWVYVTDLLGNTKLIKSDTVIRLDTIAPRFDEIVLDIKTLESTKDSTTYELFTSKFIDGYKLYVDSDGNSIYEEISFENSKATFSVSGLDTVNFKLEDEAGNAVIQSISLTLAGTVYAKAYQVGNTREVNVVIYNLGSKNIDSFRYIVTDINSGLVVGNNTINDNSIVSCGSGYETTCKSGNVNASVKNGVYNLNLNSYGKDKRIIFYIQIDGVLIDLIDRNVTVDNADPVIDFDGDTHSVISTVNGNVYSFGVKVSEDNLSNLNGKKFILTKNSNLSKSNFNTTYSSCLSNSCAKGVYNLNNSLEGIIEINSDSKFAELDTGAYYLYAYIEDDFGNKAISRTDSIYIDNETPEVKYSLNGNSSVYYDINGTVYVGGAAKLRMTDNYSVKYFEVYKENTLSAVCHINDSNLDYNCVRNQIGQIGLVIEGGIVHYYLDNGNYVIKVYDVSDNVKEVSVNVDGSNPVIELYKKVGQTYEKQISERKLYSDLTDLYVVVDDDNFNYLTIDLVAGNGTIITTASRYSYNSDVGKCLVDRNNCAYGVSLVDMIVGKTIQYNKIKINVFDKANRSTIMEINYDDLTPEIWTLDDGESIYIGGMLYVIENNKTVNIEIGVNNQLDLNTLLSKIILSVDGMPYSDVKNSELFKVTIYDGNSNLFTKEISEYIGNYTIKLNYRDSAGNTANEETIRVNVSDNTNPTIKILDEITRVEIKEDVELSGARANDNYGLEEINGSIIKDKTLFVSVAVCEVEINGVTTSCGNNVERVNDITYKFMAAGKYTFTYTITDLALNSITVKQVIEASDDAGPQMSSSVNGKTTFELYFGARKAGALNIENISLSYPNSYDKGDGENKTVEFVGLYGLNNMGDKYKMDDSFLISNINGKVVYSFKKVGTYYVRFSSSDSNDNVSIFEYEVKVMDTISPVISGVANNQIIKMGIEEEFSVEYLISKYSISADDNYDSNVKIYYELNKSDEHSHEVVLKVSDSSNNTTSITIHVDIEDYMAPVVGELVLPTSTGDTSVDITILGGSDNSSNWWHEYSIQGGSWVRIDENTKVQFGEGLNSSVQVCIRAVDAANNISLSQSCKVILVDTKKPIITGIEDGDIVSTEVKISVSDDRLESVEVFKDDNLLGMNQDNLPITLSEEGSYRVIARDTLGNETIVCFIINLDVYMNITNDINSEGPVITSVEYDKRFLVKVDVSYDSNGHSNIYTKLDNVRINANDMLYILGVLPDSDNKFVIFSANGVNISNYANGVNLIGNGNSFKEGVNNEDCFVKFEDQYYAYVMIKENAYTDNTVGVVDDNLKNSEDNKLLSVVLIVVGAFVVVLIGYQIIKFRKRVRAA